MAVGKDEGDGVAGVDGLRVTLADLGQARESRETQREEGFRTWLKVRRESEKTESNRRGVRHPEVLFRSLK